MEFLNFPIVALGAALICLIGVTIYAITQRSSLRSRDEQLVVARAQAYAMLELSQAGVLFLDREHKLMGEASAAAPELLGHTCGAGTAFVQVIADLVDVNVRRETVAYPRIDVEGRCRPRMVDATQNPLARVHSGARHLAIRFSRLVVDGRVHHIIVSIERIAAPRVVPHTIEVPVLNEDTFAKRLAGETGTRPALKIEAMPAQPGAGARRGTADRPPTPHRRRRRRRRRPPRSRGRSAADAHRRIRARARSTSPRIRCRRCARSANPVVATMAALAQLKLDAAAANSDTARRSRCSPIAADGVPRPTRSRRRCAASTNAAPRDHHHLARRGATRRPSPRRRARSRRRSSIRRIARLNEVLKEIMHVDAARLETVPLRGAREGRPAARHHQTTGARAAGVPRKAGADPRAHPRRPCARRSACRCRRCANAPSASRRRSAACATNKPCQATISCRWR